FRPFDMLGGPNQALPLLVNADMRIGVDSVVGTQPRFRRNCDFDLLLFQFSGRTALESEYGPVELGPGELALIPGGVAYRASGTADCLRLYAELRDPMVPLYGPAQYASHSEFEMVREGGPLWPAPNGAAPAPTDRVLEELALWDETPDQYTLLERDYGDVAGRGRGSWSRPPPTSRSTTSRGRSSAFTAPSAARRWGCSSAVSATTCPSSAKRTSCPARCTS